MLINQVERVPAIEETFVYDLGFPVSMEFLAWQPINVDVESVLKAFILHPIATVAKEFDFTASTDSSHVLNNLGPD